MLNEVQVLVMHEPVFLRTRGIKAGLRKLRVNEERSRKIVTALQCRLVGGPRIRKVRHGRDTGVQSTQPQKLSRPRFARIAATTTAGTPTTLAVIASAT